MSVAPIDYPYLLIGVVSLGPRIAGERSVFGLPLSIAGVLIQYMETTPDGIGG